LSGDDVSRKILICGACGFIGRNAAEYFSKLPDTEVYGTYNKSEPYHADAIRFVKADLTDRADVDRVTEGMDIIIQAAATTSGAKEIVQKPYVHVTDNALMNSLLLRAAFEKKVSHFIFFSCTTMYQTSGDLLKETDFNANDEINANYYGGAWTKVYMEKMCEFYSRIGSTKFTVIRHSNIYGPYDKYDLERSHVFGATVTKVMQAEDNIVVWGTGEEKRDLLYVSDLVDFVEAALDRQSDDFALYNVGCGTCIPVIDIVKKIIAASGKELKIEHDLSRPTIKTSLALDTGKAEKELDWKPAVSLEDGIDKTIAWYKDNVVSHLPERT
jgi:nucleoside-diphosphate-sugar epimerase